MCCVYGIAAQGIADFGESDCEVHFALDNKYHIETALAKRTPAKDSPLGTVIGIPFHESHPVP